MEKEQIHHPHNLVLDFSLLSNSGVRANGETDFSFEEMVTHLDLFFFDVTGGQEEFLHYERIIADGSSSGERELRGIKLENLKGKRVKIYVVANSKIDVTTLGNTKTIGGLKSLQEETTYINLTGYTGFEYDLPQSFLMTGLATNNNDSNTPPDESNYTGIEFPSDMDITENYRIKVILVRAAAKVEMHFKKNAGSKLIYAFGMPKSFEEGNYTAEQAQNIKLEDLTAPEHFSYLHNSYYIRNLRYVTPLWGEASATDKRKTNPITNGGYMIPSKTGVTNAEGSVDDVKVIAYIYSYSWGGTDESEAIFENAPFLIVNLPAILYKDAGTGTGTGIGEYMERNYYEIPFRTTKSDSDGGKFSLKRNYHYKIVANVDAPGAQTSMEPVMLEPIYYEAFPWNERTIDIGGEVTDVKYLNLNTYAIEMHNATTNSEIKFASSTPVKNVKLVRAYYINKAGKEVDNRNPSASSTANTLNGTITVNSTYPEGVDNVIMYMTFEVENQDGVKKSFTVTQYPTVYIQGILGYFSYRTDFGGTDLLNYGQSGRIAAQWSNNGWSYSSNYDRNNTYRTFNSKEAGTNFNNDGHVSMIYYYWTTSGWGTNKKYQLNYYTSISHYLNPRMYHITITTTSSDYKLGRPALDKDGYTDPSDENNELVSPSFMIASGLGATQAMTAANAAKTHCREYAETYRDNNGNIIRLEDWRLPTTKEIGIIAKFQQNSVAMDVVLTGNQYWSASGQPVATGVAGDTGDPKVRCVRDVYTPSPTKTNQ